MTDNANPQNASNDRKAEKDIKSDRDTGQVQPGGVLLLDWYRNNKRDLPWRRDKDPYHIWISEIMLQQTRVEAVKGYYKRFLERFPDIRALAAASEDEYLKLWEGLGYYSRVRNLHKTAVILVNEYGGRFPGSAAQLESLPGIGRYTAAAVASIAFDENAIAVDGNLLRIFSRLCAYEGNIRQESGRNAAADYFLSVLLKEQERGKASAGDFNQALMDLGAGVCVPNAAPACGQCPWNGACRAHMQGKEREYPHVPEKKARPVEERTIFLIHYDRRIVLRKRPEKGLLAGLYEFPGCEGSLDAAQAAAIVRKLGFSPLRIRPLAGAKHIFTHREWHMTGYDVLVDETEPAAGEGLIFADRQDLDTKYSVPGAFSAFRRQILF